MGAVRRGRRGQSLVELALCLPLLMMILCAVIEFGFMFYQTMRISDACREGARLGAQGADDNAVKNRVRELAPDLNIPLANITVEELNAAGQLQSANRTQGNRLQLRVNHTMTTLTPMGVLFLDNASNQRTIWAKATFCCD